MMLIICIFVVGGLSNFVALKYNGGKMPIVSDVALADEFHTAHTNYEGISYPAFVDKYKVGGHIYSLGDFLLIIFGTLIIILIFVLFVQFHRLGKLNKRYKLLLTQ